MTITQARNVLRLSATNAGDSTAYTNEQIDLAIQTIGDDFIEFTRAVRRTDDLTFGAADSTPTLTTIVAAGFRPDLAIRVWIPPTTTVQGAELDLVDHGVIVASQIESNETGMPTKIGFDSTTTAELYPTPDVAYAGKITWATPFSSWTAGTTDGTTLATVLNLPDPWLRQILRYGGPAVLHANELEHKSGNEFVKKYLAFRDSKSFGAFGAQESERDMLSES